MIDQTITIGNLIEIGTISIGLISMFVALRGTVTQLKTDLVEVKEDLCALNKVVVELAVTDRRLSTVEEDIRELRHGRGFVQKALVGEWPK